MQLTTSMFGDGEMAWEDLYGRQDDVIRVEDGHVYLSTLDPKHGLNPGVLIRIDLPDGKAVIVNASLRLLAKAVEDIAEVYHDLWMDRSMFFRGDSGGGGGRKRTVRV